MAQDHAPNDIQRAVFTILAGAVLVDGKLRLLESVELDALMKRTPTLWRLSESERDQLRADTVRQVRKSLESHDTRWDRMIQACKVLKRAAHGPEDTTLRQSVFLQSLDLVHMDDHLTPRTKRGRSGLHEDEEKLISLLHHFLWCSDQEEAQEHQGKNGPPLKHSWMEEEAHDLMRLKNSI